MGGAGCSLDAGVCSEGLGPGQRRGAGLDPVQAVAGAVHEVAARTAGPWGWHAGDGGELLLGATSPMDFLQDAPATAALIPLKSSASSGGL